MAADDPDTDSTELEAAEEASEELQADEDQPEEAAEDGLNDAGPAPKKRGKGLWLLALGGVAAIAGGVAFWAGPQPAANHGEPVVVLKLPAERTSAKPPGAGPADAPMRKSIDPDKPEMKTALEPDDARPLEAGNGQAADTGTKSVRPGSAAPRRAPDAPPGMKTARITDPARGGVSTSGNRAPKLVITDERGLQARTAYGRVPAVGKDGRRPSEVYARRAPAPPGNRRIQARIALVLGGMGISSEGTHVAINRLPPDVTLAFAPYGSGLQMLVDKARRDGHEVMLQLPMEPFDYPDNDPGPKTMLTGLPPSENVKRLEWLMSRFTGFFGVMNYMGARFTTSEPSLKPVLNWVAQHGLVFLDDGHSPRSKIRVTGQSVGLNVVRAHEIIDDGQTRDSIEQALKRLETRAMEDGLAIGVGSGLPVTVSLITAWSKTLKEKGIQLVPVSSTFQNQKS